MPCGHPLQAARLPGNSKWASQIRNQYGPFGNFCSRRPLRRHRHAHPEGRTTTREALARSNRFSNISRLRPQARRLPSRPRGVCRSTTTRFRRRFSRHACPITSTLAASGALDSMGVGRLEEDEQAAALEELEEDQKIWRTPFST
jgi:hypothetical protein